MNGVRTHRSTTQQEHERGDRINRIFMDLLKFKGTIPSVVRCFVGDFVCIEKRLKKNLNLSTLCSFDK